MINKNVGHSIFGDLHHGSCGFCLREMQWKVEQAHGQNEVRLRLIFSRKSELPDLLREVGFSILDVFGAGHSEEIF